MDLSPTCVSPALPPECRSAYNNCDSSFIPDSLHLFKSAVFPYFHHKLVNTKHIHCSHAHLLTQMHILPNLRSSFHNFSEEWPHLMSIHNKTGQITISISAKWLESAEVLSWVLQVYLFPRFPLLAPLFQWFLQSLRASLCIRGFNWLDSLWSQLLCVCPSQQSTYGLLSVAQ